MNFCFDFVCEYGLDIIEFIFAHYDAFRYLGTTAKGLTKLFLFKQR
jgi:hypothetical protein